jgi:hypothetical protein
MADKWEQFTETTNDTKATASGKWGQFEEGAGRPISTITGNLIPTPEEAWTQNKKVIGAVLPIAGDIAGSLLVPELKGPQMGLRLLNMLFRGAGAATGGFTGSVVGQKVEKGNVNYPEALMQGGIGAGSELGFGGLGLVKKPIMKLASNLTVAGNQLRNFLQDRLVRKTTERAEKFITDIAPDMVKNQQVAMNDIGLMVNSAFDENKAVYKLYEKALVQGSEKEGGRVLLDDTAQYLGTLRDKVNVNVNMNRRKNQALFDNRTVREFGYAPTSQEGMIIKDLLETDSATPQNVEYLLARVLKTWKTDSPAIQSSKESLKKALMKDLDKVATDAGESVGDIKKAADETYKAVARFNGVRKIYAQAITENKMTGETTVQAHKLAKLIYGNEGTIKRDLPELWDKLKGEADYYARISEKLRDTEGSAKLKDLAKSPWGTVAATYFGGPAGGATAEAFGAVSAWALMGESDRKLLKYIAEGVAKPTAKAGLHLGGRTVFFDREGQQ